MPDSTGFDTFYRDTSRRVLTAVYALTGDSTEAQDLVQEAYARAWQRWNQLAGYDDPEAWVRLVAFRLATSRWRSARRWLAIRERLAPQPVAGPSPDGVAIFAALRQLPPGQRQAIVLHHLCDVPVARVAAMTGTPEGTVKVWLARARRTLAGLLVESEEVRDVH